MVYTQAEINKINKGKCITRYCANDFYVSPKGKEEHYCTKCRRRRHKKANPLRYHYDLFRQNAKTHGKDFDLTFKEYCDFALEHKLLDNKGRKKTSLTVDRINSAIGYTADNIQILTLQENSRKGYAYGNHSGIKDKHIEDEQNTAECPF